MDASAFQAILARFLTRVPGALAAILVDDQGEAVDYHLGRAGPASPNTAVFDVRIAAAHWKIVLDEIGTRGLLGRPDLLLVRGTSRSFYAQALADRYALIVVLGRRAGFGISPRALSVCERALHREAGWKAPPVTRAWHEVDVACDARDMPIHARAVAADPDEAPAIEVHELVGRVVGLRAGERGYRVRLVTGLECTLVRERRTFWYADQNLAISTRSAASLPPARKES